MNVDRAVFVFAGFVVLLGIALSLLINPWWLALSIFAGLNMIQAAFTGCPALQGAGSEVRQCLSLSFCAIGNRKMAGVARTQRSPGSLPHRPTRQDIGERGPEE